MLRICVCIPVYNDWKSVFALIADLDRVAMTLESATDILLIDDGSDQMLPSWSSVLEKVGSVSVLRLRRNVGHQRAIAIGLTWLYETTSYDCVVVMDGDGEDAAKDVPALLARCREEGFRRIVFAQRAKRSESFGFRAGYVGFRLLHGLLTGRKVEVGNFSVIPRSALARLVGVSEIWNHYAAAVSHAKLPIAMVPVPRGKRIDGESKMNLVSLVTHGLSAISVYSDVVGVRLLAAAGALGALAVVLLGVVAFIKLRTELAIPGWATNVAGMLFITLLNLAAIGLALVLFTLKSRAQSSFVPLRDYQHYVLDCAHINVQLEG